VRCDDTALHQQQAASKALSAAVAVLLLAAPYRHTPALLRLNAPAYLLNLLHGKYSKTHENTQTEHVAMLSWI